jgi:hypothetical protein
LRYEPKTGTQFSSTPSQSNAPNLSKDATPLDVARNALSVYGRSGRLIDGTLRWHCWMLSAKFKIGWLDGHVVPSFRSVTHRPTRDTIITHQRLN